jgi:hypothetical protein
MRPHRSVLRGELCVRLNRSTGKKLGRTTRLAGLRGWGSQACHPGGTFVTGYEYSLGSPARIAEGARNPQRQPTGQRSPVGTRGGSRLASPLGVLPP